MSSVLVTCTSPVYTVQVTCTSLVCELRHPVSESLAGPWQVAQVECGSMTAQMERSTCLKQSTYAVDVAARGTMRARSVRVTCTSPVRESRQAVSESLTCPWRVAQVVCRSKTTQTRMERSTCPWINSFLPTSRKVLAAFQTFCPVGVRIAQTVVDFAHIQVQSRKRAVLGWFWGCFVYVHIQERGVWRMSKEQGLVVVFRAKWDPIWAKRDPSGRFVWKMGKSALKNFNHNLP